MNTQRILLADNIGRFLKTRCEFLVAAGFEVLTASTSKEAVQHLLEARIHLAILDIRMDDDNDAQDTSGLDIAKNPLFRPIPKIMITGFPTYEAAREALGPELDGLPPAVEFLAKKEGAEAMVAAAKIAFAEYVRINRQLEIRGGQSGNFFHLIHLIEREIAADRLSDRAGELEDLFRKLFYANSQITISRILRQGQAQIYLEVFAFGGDELKGQYVISCGLRSQISAEKDRHETWAPWDGGIGTTRLVAHKETIHFGAIAYSLVGGDLEEMEPLSDYLGHHDNQDVRGTLDHLYHNSLANWHRTNRYYAEDQSLQALYFDWLGISLDQISITLVDNVTAICRETVSNGLARIDCSPNTLTFHLMNGNSHSLPNPAQFVTEKSFATHLPVLCGITHGHVTTDSVLVDNSGRTWLIGFSRMGEGPLLRDFVLLEDAIKTDLSNSGLLAFDHRLEERLLDVKSLDEAISVEKLSPAQSKILNSVIQIRKLASETAGAELGPYLAALLACSLAHIATIDAKMNHYTRRELTPFIRSLFSAAMLYSRLIIPPPPKDPLPLESIEIDEDNHIVFVEGEQIDLTIQEYAIVIYLYQHANKLCTRQAIVSEALQESGEEKWEKGRLNSAMSRLRLKIEPDPKQPKYIITVRGRGYKLAL